ncbi:autotransporter outer membrane beta-barrel domain-containing protein [Sphingomonas sp. AX6]|uniref:autotransporter outer membrane beta-barrel domain-containing protein n=1 Tax=Sphingomonas sp. AX6 TaxID=2653171 RepID=UPI001F48F843|nr:autotransporter outer membrane beta-barrel domain-containing protein [Sphingomonas sp. AX6]
MAQVGPVPPTGAEDTPHARPTASEETPQIVISQPGTPTTARDPVDVNGIGQMFVAAANGGIGTCTGTLINPRTMIFAAHCVNTQPQTSYGSSSGGTPIAFGFKADNLAGIQQWFLPTIGGQANPRRFQTNANTLVHNVDQVFWHPGSTARPQGAGFLEADVAIASFDTPTRDIPTWAMLFSALPAPAAVSGTTGTGYHVTLTGYGRSGIGNVGDSNAIDWRRRVAENFIGILGSFNDRDLFLFGTPSGLPQNLYQLDFDDPRRGTAAASPFDFNLFKDRALPNEGTTAGGDSGGPLILDQTYGEKVVLGVLSGGSRFFGPQPFSTYGTSSFYQPLYLYWDWIAQNNPYRYVGAKAGDGNWEDAARWSSLLDPSYRVLDANGRLVAGVPNDPGAGALGNDPNGFGQICFDSPTLSQCFDVATGRFLINGVVVNSEAVSAEAHAAIDAGLKNGTGAASQNGLMVEDRPTNATATLSDDGDVRSGAASVAMADGDAAPAALPPATIANGLPGASGFIPNNVVANPRAGVVGRYYDVTLSATGTTTLSSAATIDNLTITGSGARLNIGSAGSLTSLIEVNQLAGMVAVDGRLTTLGDYFLMTGGLQGRGTIATPFFTNIAGMIAPGGTGTIGTLTFNGNVILASGSNLLIDLGDNGTSDRVAVAAGSGQPGRANIGGFVGFAPVSGFRLRDNQRYTILTAQGGVTGTFMPGAAFSAILTPRFTYSANSVQMEIEAGLYGNVVDRSSPIQLEFARLLDQNRGQYDRFADLYGELDLQNQATIRSQLEGFAPHAQNAGAMQGIVATDTTSRFIRNRMLGSGQANAGGTVAMYGKPVQLASLATSNLASDIQSDVGNGMTVQQGVLPDSVAIYLAGGYIDGKGMGLPTATPTGRGDFDGYFIAAGVEAFPDDVSTLGFAMTYSDLDGNTVVPTQNASSQLVQGTLYGTAMLGRLKLDAMVSAGVFEVDTSRQVPVGATSFDLRATDRAFAFQSEAGIGFDMGGGGFSLTPRASARVSRIEFTDTVERGGGPALQYDLGTFDSFQGRAGATAKVTTGAFRPYVTANYVHEFEDRPAFFGANFRGGVGPQALIALPGTDRDWAEVSGGVAFGTDRISFAVEAETTIERKDVSNQAYKGTVTFRF